MKHTVNLILIALMLVIQSCSKEQSIGAQKSTEHKFQLSTKVAGDASDKLTNITAYAFSGQTLVKIFPNLPLTESTVTLYLPAKAKVYFLAGLSTLPASLNSLEVGKTSEEDFLALSCDAIVKEDAGSESTMFYTGYYDGAKSTNQSKVDMQMIRSVSRLDIDTSSDPLTKITSVVASGVPLSSSIFGSPANGTTVSVTKEFQTPISGKHEGIMYIFESKSLVQVTINGTYNDMPIIVNVDMPSVKRNTAYVVKIKNSGGSVSGTVSIKEWEKGETVDGQPDVNTTIAIDKEHSTIDTGITIDETANHIRVSPSGGNLSLALSAQSSLEVSSIDGQNPLINIGTPTAPEVVGGKLITKIPINILAQGKGRLPYQVRINVKSSLTVNPYDYITIDVDGNQDQIPTVQFCGYEIMAFNTTGSNLADQVYLVDGTSVLDMYNNNWGDCTGRMYQFGRLPGSFPYETLNRQPTPPFMVWNEDNGAPCPDGFRMLTSAELHKIMPPNTANFPLNGSKTVDYRVGDQNVRMDFVVPSKTISMGSYRNITPRYMRLTHQDEVLIFPLAGYGWNTKAATNIGERFFVIASNRDSGGIKAYGYSTNDVQNQHSNVQPRHTENNSFVRCIKK